MTNLEHNIQSVNELSKVPQLSEDHISKLNSILNTILNSETMIKGSFENESISCFVLKSIQSTTLDKMNIIEPYVNEYLNSSSYESFVLEMDLTKSQFDLVLNKNLLKYNLDKLDIKINKKFFTNFIKFLHKNKLNLIDMVGIKYLDKIGKFNGNLKNLIDALRLILLAIKSKEEIIELDEVTSLLTDYNCFEPNLFDIQLELINDENLTNLVKKKIQPISVDRTLSTCTDVKELIEEYRHTLGEKDVEIFSKLKQLDPQLKCLLFSCASKLNKSNDLEQKQAKISDFIALKIEENLINNSMRNFPIKRKLDEKWQNFEPNIYDPVYMLPNLYDLLDFGKLKLTFIFLQIFFSNF